MTKQIYSHYAVGKKALDKASEALEDHVTEEDAIVGTAYSLFGIGCMLVEAVDNLSIIAERLEKGEGSEQ